MLSFALNTGKRKLLKNATQFGTSTGVPGWAPVFLYTTKNESDNSNTAVVRQNSAFLDEQERMKNGKNLIGVSGEVFGIPTQLQKIRHTGLFGIVGSGRTGADGRAGVLRHWPSVNYVKHERFNVPPKAALVSNGSNEFFNDRMKFTSRADEERYKRELHTINVAVIVNCIICAAKFAACYTSMSSSMFAEAIHSLADVGNQILLRKGVVQALKGPTPMYPYGFSRDKFVWSLISAVGIFFLGAGVSLFNGIQGLIHPREIEDLTLVFWVLGGSFLLEGYSFTVALRTVMHNAAKRGMKLFDYVWLGKDPTPIAVMLEDSGAVIGIMMAGACTALSNYTGSSLWDSLGSVAVGLLMGGVASFLIRMNRSFLIGRSISKHEMSLIMKQLKGDPVVKNVYDYKSEEIGPGKYRFKAEIDFCGEVVVERHLKGLDRDEVYQRLRHASWAPDNRALHMALKEYGKELVSQVGAEVDRLEANIRKAVPGVVHVDLEVDRGKIEKYFKRVKDSVASPEPIEIPHEMHSPKDVIG